jgi:hypothetical protein
MQDRSQHYVPFTFRIKLPKLMKARNIVVRDGRGWIVRSILPGIGESGYV